MSIIIVSDKGAGNPLIAVQTDGTANSAGQIVAKYQFVTNENYQDAGGTDNYAFTGNPGNNAQLDNVVVSESGDMYAHAYATYKFEHNGTTYQPGEYLVKVVPAGDTTTDENGVTTIPVTVEPIQNDDGTLITPVNPSDQDSLSFINYNGKEYLLASNSNSQVSEESGSLLIDPETGRSTAIKLDTNGFGASGGIVNLDQSTGPGQIDTAGTFNYDGFRVIQDGSTGKSYLIGMSENGHGFFERYEVTFTDGGPGNPPVMTIDEKSRTALMQVGMSVSGYSLNDDGSVTVISRDNDGKMTTITQFATNGTTYDSFEEYAIAKQGGSTTFEYIQPFSPSSNSPGWESTDYRYISGISYQQNYEGELDSIPLICFGAGTLIRTERGEIQVENLSVSDMVLTVDHGLLPIRWIGKRRLSADDLAKQPNLRPIRICADALGKGLPERDMLVSPQHRVLIRSRIAQRMFNTDEVLVAAKHLLAIEGIEVAEDVTVIEYYHLLFDAHQLIWSNGTVTESLYTGPEALKAVDPAARVELMTLFPELDLQTEADCAPPARPLVEARKGCKLAKRHHRNNQPLKFADNREPDLV